MKWSLDAGTRARLQRPLRRAGLPGVAGMLILAACVPVAAWVLPSLQQEAQALRDAADTAVSQASRRSRSAAAGLGTQAPEQVFARAFPDAGTRAARLATLLATAQRHAVSLPRSEFRYSVEPALGLGHYRVNLAATASYAALFAFVADTLRRDAALSLDSIALHRDHVDAAALRAEMVFTLHVRDDGIERSAGFREPAP